MTTILHGAAVVLPTHVQADGVVVIEDGRIAYAGPRAGAPEVKRAVKVDLRGRVVAPGLIDLHINGFGGVDVFNASKPSLAKMGRSLAAHGVTSYLPTLVTSPFPSLLRALARLTTVVAEAPGDGVAEPLGVFLEGPFLADAKRGAHPSQDLRTPRSDAVRQVLELLGSRARIVALAPELPGALDAIRELAKAGCVVGLAHSNADAALCAQAVAAGARHVVHLFNAMGPMHHRAPGLAGFTLGSGEVTAEIVADGHHVDRFMVAAAWRALGAHRLALVSDALAPAGLPLANGATFRLESGLGRVVVRRDLRPGILPRAETQGGTLAGSLASLTDCVRFAVRSAGIPLFDAVTMASTTPARIAGVSRRKGALTPGLDADVLVLDGDLAPERVWVRGEPVEDVAVLRAAPEKRRKPARR